MTDEQKNFLGIPINGSITMGNKRVAQAPFEELQEEIQKLLEFKSFTKLKWRQYTPYFNDGDPCEFSIYGVGIAVPPMAEGEDDMDEIGDYEDGTIDLPNTYMGSYYTPEMNAHILKFVGLWDSGTYNRETMQHEGGGWKTKPEHPKMIEQATKVARLIENGTHYDSLLQTFGDHAIVTLSKTEIEVEEYSHD